MSSNVIFIHYPSGGYGFYLTRLINRYISGIVRVDDTFEFDSLGTSHSLPLVYGHVHWNKNRGFDPNSYDPRYHDSIVSGNNVLVPYCPGINDDRISETLEFFPQSRLIRLWYDDKTWPLVFFNTIVKALEGSVNKDVFFDPTRFGSSSDWARRENFSLLFENHPLRMAWKAKTHDRVHNINILSLLTDTENSLQDIAAFLGQSLQANHMDMQSKHQKFLQHNSMTVLHLEILTLLDDLRPNRALHWVPDLFWQAVINFYIKQRFGFEVPCNTYSDWFDNTEQIVIMLKKQGIEI